MLLLWWHVAGLFHSIGKREPEKSMVDYLQGNAEFVRLAPLWENHHGWKTRGHVESMNGFERREARSAHLNALLYRIDFYHQEEITQLELQSSEGQRSRRSNHGTTLELCACLSRGSDVWVAWLPAGREALRHLWPSEPHGRPTGFAFHGTSLSAPGNDSDCVVGNVPSFLIQQLKTFFLSLAQRTSCSVYFFRPLGTPGTRPDLHLAQNPYVSVKAGRFRFVRISAAAAPSWHTDVSDLCIRDLFHCEIQLVR